MVFRRGPPFGEIRVEDHFQRLEVFPSFKGDRGDIIYHLSSGNDVGRIGLPLVVDIHLSLVSRALSVEG